MRTSPATAAALAALLALTLLTSGCITTDDAGKITIDLGGLTNATDRLGDAPGEVGKRVDPGGLVKNIGRSNATKVEFPLGSVFETGYFEGNTLVIRLSKVENMDRVAAIDPDGNKLDELPVEPAQRRIEILLPSPPTPGTYELVKLTETDDDEQEAGSVEFTLDPRPEIIHATAENFTLTLRLGNTGNSPDQLTRIKVISGNRTLTTREYLDTREVYRIEDDEKKLVNVTTGYDGPILRPGRTIDVDDFFIPNDAEDLSVEVHTRYSKTITKTVTRRN